MGLSSSKTTSESGPSKQALPYLTSASGAVQGAYDGNQENLSHIGSGLSSAFDSFKSNMGNDPTMAAARGYVTDTLGRDSSVNPNLDAIVSTTNDGITDRINALFNKAGQSGSSRQQGEIAKQVSANESGLRYNDWQEAEKRKAAAVQQALALQGGDNQSAATLAALGQSAASTPYLGAQFLAQGLGGLWGNAQTQTQTKQDNLGAMLLNAGAQAGSAAIMASDRRLKDDIERIGEMSDGLPVYSYRYRDDPQTFIGVMADEVADFRPWALGPEIDGYGSVDYGAL